MDFQEKRKPGFILGDHIFMPPIFSAPMAGISDAVYRDWARRHGASLLWTEMISGWATVWQNQATLEMFPKKNEKDVVVQFLVSDPGVMKKASAEAYSRGAAAIDINMACPARKVVKSGGGAALLNEPKLCGDLVREAVKSSQGLPVTVKLRLDHQKNDRKGIEVAKRAADAGASAITMHPRSASQGFSGNADWSSFEEVKEHVPLPLIASGDLFTPEDVVRLFSSAPVDAAMLARGALGNPWIFSRLNSLLNTGTLPPEPAPEQKVQAALDYLRDLIREYGENKGVRESKKHLLWFLKGLPHSHEVKKEVVPLMDINAMEKILIDYKEKLESGYYDVEDAGPVPGH